MVAGWMLLLHLQVWWAIGRIGARGEWAFPEFLVFLLSVAIPYVIARLCFPEELAESGLEAYYPRVAPVIFLLVAATYASFALLLQPFIVGGIDPPVFVSQPVLVVLAVVAGGCESPASRFVVLAAMISQAAWRGLSGVIGNRAIATGGFVSNGFSSGNGGRFDASPRSKGSLGQWERL